MVIETCGGGDQGDKDRCGGGFVFYFCVAKVKRTICTSVQLVSVCFPYTDTFIRLFTLLCVEVNIFLHRFGFVICNSTDRIKVNVYLYQVCVSMQLLYSFQLLIFASILR